MGEGGGCGEGECHVVSCWHVGTAGCVLAFSEESKKNLKPVLLSILSCDKSGNV